MLSWGQHKGGGGRVLSLLPDTKLYDIKELFSRGALGKSTHILDILHICEHHQNIPTIFSKENFIFPNSSYFFPYLLKTYV